MGKLRVSWTLSPKSRAFSYPPSPLVVHAGLCNLRSEHKRTLPNTLCDLLKPCLEKQN